MSDLSLFDLTGKKAFVTGAAVGIGRGCAIALAQAGADVAIVDLNEKAGLKTVEEIRSLGRDSLWVRCDVTQREQVQEMVRRIAHHFGRLGPWRGGDGQG
jgi:meso-butanediol dehydrogenase/(S,S)-butanediol dehydrogenase/diacetyl reductase